jgi:ribosomal-protein-alanine N-acetyltransferase
VVAGPFFTDDGQREVIRGSLEEQEQGSTVPHVNVDDSGRVVGRIARGPFPSCSLGYWVSAADNGRCLATAAVHDIVHQILTNVPD